MNIAARLAEISQRKVEIRGQLESEKSVDLEALETELKALEEEEKELRKRQEIAAGIQDGTVPTRSLGATPAPNQEARDVDRHDTLEYRRAFMRYVTRGARGTALEFRDDGGEGEGGEPPASPGVVTGLGDIGAVIPTTILNRIVEQMEESGRIWSRVTQTSIQGGVQIPVASAKPTASWVAAGTVAEKQGKAVSGSILFAYHKLQCRVVVELVAATVALPVFEATIANNIAEAMVKALDEAIIAGAGDGEPLGIVKDEGVPKANVVEMTAAEFTTYKKWASAMGAVPRRYRNGVAIIMNDDDWNTHIVGMVDTNKQPIARVTYGLDGTIQERFLGREVIAVEDLLPSIDAASAGDVVAILVRLGDYMINSNMAITYRRYFDENTDEWISKATMIADGKLADPHGVVLIKKKS